MFELPVAATGAVQIPTRGLNHAYDLPDFHVKHPRGRTPSRQPDALVSKGRYTLRFGRHAQAIHILLHVELNAADRNPSETNQYKDDSEDSCPLPHED